MSQLPNGCVVGDTHQVTFEVTPKMVQRFAELTADRSSLHTDPAFGRRSMYRQNVVHGMLPVMFLAALKPCWSSGAKCSIQRLAARFLKPVFISDRLELKAEVTAIHPEQNLCELEFSLQQSGSAMVVTTGSFVLAFGQADLECAGEANEAADLSLVIEALEEQCPQFSAINKGDEKAFRFAVAPVHARMLHAIFSDGLAVADRIDFATWANGCVPNNLLGTSLLSTFVGMCIPGKYATFLDFQITVNQALRWSRPYLLQGKVTFKSQSTLTLVQSIFVREAEGKAEIATGKINSKVNEPPLAMPTFASLKAQDSDLGLKDKVVLVTGSSRGIGETTAKLFAVHGAKVVLNYFRGREDATRIVEEITAHGGVALAVQADVTDREQVKQMLGMVRERFQTVNVLVNNAADNFTPVSFMDLTWDALQKDLDVIVKGAFHCSQEVIPFMLKSGGGKIINISTVATEAPPPHQAKYVIAKSALDGLSRSLAVEFAAQNIQVNMVVPSIVETDLTKHVPKMFLDGIRNDTPMKRIATPVDVAKAVVFLASSLASFTTGQKVMVTGGSPPFL